MELSRSGGSRDSTLSSILSVMFSDDSPKHRSDTMSVVMSYVVFSFCAMIVMGVFSECSYSAILTLGAAVQCLGFYLLLVKVQRQRSVAGLSSKTLEVYFLVFIFRLSSTLVRNGYLPVDRSGDFVYQSADIISLVCVLRLLTCMQTMRKTYQEAYDSFAVGKCVPVCVLMAIVLHGNLNASWFFDTTWTISMNLDTIALLPQLWMLTKIGGEVEGMTSHFIALVLVSRACQFAFWFYGFRELQRDGSNLAGWQLIIMHALQLLLAVDFMYYYVKANIKGRRMTLPMSV